MTAAAPSELTKSALPALAVAWTVVRRDLQYWADAAGPGVNEDFHAFLDDMIERGQRRMPRERNRGSREGGFSRRTPGVDRRQLRMTALSGRRTGSEYLVPNREFRHVRSRSDNDSGQIASGNVWGRRDTRAGDRPVPSSRSDLRWRRAPRRGHRPAPAGFRHVREIHRVKAAIGAVNEGFQVELSLRPGRAGLTSNPPSVLRPIPVPRPRRVAQNLSCRA